MYIPEPLTRNELIEIVTRLEKEGDFARAIGQAALFADNKNLAMLMETFPRFFQKSHAHLQVVKPKGNIFLSL